MHELQTAITALAAPIVESMGAYCVDVIIRGEHGTRVVQVLADTDSGITIETCAEVSRAVSQAIEQEQLLSGSYRLEVSSPGIDKPLRLLRQYSKNTGRLFTVRFEQGGEQKTLKGILLSVEGSTLTFQEPNTEPRVLSFDAIIECKEVLPW